MPWRGDGDDEGADRDCFDTRGFRNNLPHPRQSTHDQVTLKLSSLLCGAQGWLNKNYKEERRLAFINLSLLICVQSTDAGFLGCPLVGPD